MPSPVQPVYSRALARIAILLLLLPACGGGGGGGSSGGGGNNPPPSPTWERQTVANVAVSGLTTPWVHAAAAAGDVAGVAYFQSNASPTDPDRPYDLIYLAWDPDTASAGTPETVASLDNTSGLALTLSGSGTPAAVYQGGVERECGGPRQSDAMLSVQDTASWNEHTAAIGDVTRNPVFTDGLAGADVAVAVDSQGRTHVLYQFRYEGCDAMNFHYADLGYVRLDAGSGTPGPEETVEGNDYAHSNTQNNVGAHAALAVDAQDQPIAFYYGEFEGGTSRGLRAARKQGSTWVPEWVDQGCEVTAVSAAVSASGTLGVAYAVGACDDPQADDHSLRYAAETGSGWTVQTVDAASWCGTHCSLAFTAAGAPVVAYRDEQSFAGHARQDLKLARLAGSVWNRETVSATGDIGLYNSLWVDSQGRAVICTYSNTDHNVYLFRKALTP